MEDLIKRLKAEEEAKSKPVFEENASSTLTDEILQLTVGWIGLPDMLSCLQTCRGWRNLLDNPFVFRQILATHSPSLLKDIEALKDSLVLNYEAIARSVICKRPSDIPPDQDVGVRFWIPKPRLAPEQLFLLVGVKDKKSGKIIGSFHQSFESWNHSSGWLTIMGNEQRILIPSKVEGTFDDNFHEGDDPNVDTPDCIFDSIRFLIRLMRCDTGKSFSFGNDCDCNTNGDDNWISYYETMGRPIAKNAAGCRGRELWSFREWIRSSLHFIHRISPVFPPNLEQGENNWHEASYWLDKMEACFEVESDDELGLPHHSVRELLVLLEGYNWK